MRRPRHSRGFLADLLGTSTQGPAVLLYASNHGIAMPPCSSDYVHGRSLSALEVPYLACDNAATQAVRSNALVAETAVRAVGYGELLRQLSGPAA